MKICSNCGFSDFQKKDIITFGAVRLSYKCPECNIVSKTNIKSFIIMLIGMVFLLSSAIMLHLAKGVPVYQNTKIIGLFTIGAIITLIGIKSIKLESGSDA